MPAKTDSITTPLLEVAVRYASLGLPVFPLKPGTKEPLVKWRRDATRDEATIHGWWERWPDANIAIPTGKASGLFVLDIDGEEGAATIVRLQAEHGKLPTTMVARTPGGIHVFYSWWDGLGNSARKLGPGLDTRGEGGYVVAPPSKRPEGEYRWHGSGVQTIADLPDWLIALLVSTPTQPSPTPPPPSITKIASASSLPDGAQEDKRRVKAANTIIERASELQEGDRNHGTFRQAAALRKVATSEDEWEYYRAEFLDALPYGPSSNGNKPFTRAEAEATVRSAEASVPLGTWTPTGERNPLALTETRRDLMELLKWVYVQPWKGRAGTYDRLGHMAVLRIAWRVNRTTNLAIAYREFGELIGTPSHNTASRVLNRIVEQGKLRRCQGEREVDEPYRYDLVPFEELARMHNGDTHLSSYIATMSMTPLCISQAPLVPDAFRTPRGLPKGAWLLLQYLDEPLSSKDLEQLTGKVQSTISRYLAALKGEELVEQTNEGKWVKTNADLEQVAKTLHTTGASDKLRLYNQQQREQYHAYLKHKEREHAEEVRHEAGQPTDNGTPSRSNGPGQVHDGDTQPLH